MVSPVPGQLKCPQQCHNLTQILRTCKNKCRSCQHLKEHNKKENQESIPKPFAFHSTRNILFSGEPNPSAQQLKQLSTSTKAIAVSFFTAGYCHNQRNKETQQPQPCKQYIQKAENQVSQWHNPQILIPFLFYCSTSQTEITLAGHSFTHLPHPTQRCWSTFAVTPKWIEMAPIGHTLTQQSQATQSLVFTTAFFLFRVILFMIALLLCLVLYNIILDLKK